MRQKGFTLIELMVTISITAVLGALGIAGLANYNKAQVLRASTNEVVSMLNLAKSRAQSQIKPSGVTCGTLSGYTVGIVKTGSDSNYTLTVRCSGTDITPPLVTKYLPKDLSFDTSKTFFFPVRKGGVETQDQFDIISGGNRKTIKVDILGGVSVQ